MRAPGFRGARAPDGTDWTVGRLWFGERKLKSWRWRLGIGSKLADGDVGVLDAFDGLDLESGLVLLAAAAAIVLIVVPLLLFGVELIIVGCALAIGVVSRSLFGKPWTVAATRDGAAIPAALWRVRGWRASSELIEQICIELEARGRLASDFPQAAFIERVD
ncbi:MAG TPA: hypothetical protein VG293_03240 [Solirubrobacteraceae bacterium]|nr:hypothetical protein [Solirubrobacteraceae bacterium]